MIVTNASTSSCTPSSMEGAGFNKGENLGYAVEVVHSVASVIAGCKSDVVRDKSSRRSSGSKLNGKTQMLTDVLSTSPLSSSGDIWNMTVS